MARVSKLKILSIVVTVAVICVVMVNLRHLQSLQNEATQKGFQCVISHQWFGSIHVYKVDWRRAIPGWRISILETQRGYHPHSASRLVAAINHFPGPEKISFIDLPQGLLEETLGGLRRQLSTDSLLIVRYGGHDHTWELLKCFPNLEELEITATNTTGASLPAFSNLVEFWSDFGTFSDAGLLALSASPNLSEVQFSHDYVQSPEEVEGLVTEEGLREFFSKCNSLTSFYATVHMDAETIDRVVADLRVQYPHVDISIRPMLTD